jgi:alpha-ketoglutarate-dependent taurine dioxygenase
VENPGGLAYDFKSGVQMIHEFPFVMTPDANRGLKGWISARRADIDSELDRRGAILLRGFDARTEDDFRSFVQAYSHDLLPYVYRSTPRTHLGSGVYTATEYPAGQTIALHNENAYQRDWPTRLFFFCMNTAEGGGGQTPLAKTLRVTERIDPSIRDRFATKGIMYIRNYHEYIDLPWQTVFQTESKSEVEKYCSEHDINYEWRPRGALRTTQVCQAFARHPRTEALVWFNSAHMFHPSGLDVGSRKLLYEMFGEDDLPRNVKFGDGSTIDESDLQNIREAFISETITFTWRVGDILMLDNMLTSHGRTPYKGKRRVLAAMCSPISALA